MLLATVVTDRTVPVERKTTPERDDEAVDTGTAEADVTVADGREPEPEPEEDDLSLFRALSRLSEGIMKTGDNHTRTQWEKPQL